MKTTVIIVASLATLAFAGVVNPPPPSMSERNYDVFRVEQFEATYTDKAQKVLSLFRPILQLDYESEYYKIGKDYDVAANIGKYNNETIIKRFLDVYKHGTLPRNYNTPYTEFEEEMNDEAIALYELLYYAKDFKTFYESACFAKVHFSAGMFLYAYYTALVHRDDTNGVLLPQPYEAVTYLYATREDFNKMNHLKMRGNSIEEDFSIVKEDDFYIIHSNYSDQHILSHNEHLIAYFTEDKALDAYLAFFHAYFPWWWKDQFGPMKEYRGEFYYFYYQRLLARYYMERLSNGLSEVPDFSWDEPIKQGYQPLFSIPLIQRNENYKIPIEKYEDKEFLETHEKTFLQFLEDGKFNAYNKDVDLRKTREAFNFISDYWQSNQYLYEDSQPRKQRSYEMTARRLLGANPVSNEKHYMLLSAQSFPQTSFRDPVCWQLLSRITKYMMQYKKEYLMPYTYDELHFEGVMIKDVKVDKLTTLFDWYDYDFTNALLYTADEIKNTYDKTRYKIRQPRLNHKPFNVNIDIKSDKDVEAVVKVFLGPKFNSKNEELTLEHNWMNYLEIDWFLYNLTSGINTITRGSSNFTLYQEDAASTPELKNMLAQGYVPQDMYTKFEFIPNRLMLPRGHEGGFPMQLFVIVYKYEKPPADLHQHNILVLDDKPFGYPFDRPVDYLYFKQPNMYLTDVRVYHEGEMFANYYNSPEYIATHQENRKKSLEDNTTKS